MGIRPLFTNRKAMPPLHSIIENILRDTRKAKHIIYKQGQRYIAKTLHVGTPTNTTVKGIPLKFGIQELMQHFLQQPLELNGEKLMFSSQLSENIILLDNQDNHICDRAAVFSQCVKNAQGVEDDIASFLLVIAFEKTDIHINFKMLMNNIYDELKMKNVIQIYDLNAVPPEEPLKQHFMYCHETHIIFSRQRLDYINVGRPYRQQLQECLETDPNQCILQTQDQRQRIPFSVQVFLSPLSPQFEWTLYYLAELQRLYPFYYIVVCIKGVDVAEFNVIVKRCASAAELNVVKELKDQTIVDEMLEVKTSKGGKTTQLPFIANVIQMYPFDDYKNEYQQPRVIDVATSVDLLHESIVQLIQTPIIYAERERFANSKEKAPDDIQKIEMYCREDSYYRRHLVKPVEFIMNEGDEAVEGMFRFYGVDLKLYQTSQLGVPKRDDWAIVAFINPNLSNIHEILLELDTLQSNAEDKYKTKINVSVVVESSWTRNIASLMENEKMTMLRHFNIILDGNNIFRIAGDMVGAKPPYYFLFGPQLKLLETSCDFQSFAALLYSFNEEQAMERQNRTKPISTDPDPDHAISGVNENSCVRFAYSGCTGCNACVPSCQFNVLANANEKNNPPFILLKSGRQDGNDKLRRVKLDDSGCIGCGQCTAACKVGEVLTPVSHIEAVTKALASNGKTQVAIVSPAARAAITTAMRVGSGGGAKTATKQLIAALRDMGFAVVVDGVFGADMCVQLDMQEVEQNQSVRPVISSSCPAVVQLIQQKYGQFAEYLSPAKSPVEMTACAVRSQMFASKGVEVEITSISTCTAEKNLKEIDHVLTVYELVNYLQLKNEQFSAEREAKLVQEGIVQFDNPWHNCSNIGSAFGYLGGQTYDIGNVMCLNKGEKDFKLDIVKVINVDMDPKGSQIQISSFNRQGSLFKVATVSNGRGIDYLMTQFQQKNPDFTTLNYIEVMACDLGCVEGGGCTKKEANEIQRLVQQQSVARAQMLLVEAKTLIKNEIKYQNQVIQDLYSLVSRDRFVKSMMRGSPWARADPNAGQHDAQPEDAPQEAPVE